MNLVRRIYNWLLIKFGRGRYNLSACDYNKQLFGTCCHPDVRKCDGKCNSPKRPTECRRDKVKSGL